MNQETKTQLFEHIKSGRYISDTVLDIEKIMGNAGMGLYTKPCCDRIADAGLVDGVHIFHVYPSQWKLQADFYGMERCKKILERYLQPEYLDALLEQLRDLHDWTISCNNILYMLRKMKRKDLKEGRTEMLGYKLGTEEAKDVAEYLKAELIHRNLPEQIKQVAHRIGDTCKLLSMFRGPARATIPFVIEAWKAWGDSVNDTPVEGTGAHTKALRRFKDTHGGTSGVAKLKKDDLIKYIYLAVRAYGKENKAEYWHTGIKSCMELERRYGQLKQVMEAIGRLTLGELLRLYPVAKEYDGAKWGSKDYFYTMNKLKQWSFDQPIGDAQNVACLLWDYQNWDLEFLLLQWMNVLGDLHIYCNNPGPDDEFHRRLLNRERKEVTDNAENKTN